MTDNDEKDLNTTAVSFLKSRIIKFERDNERAINKKSHVKMATDIVDEVKRVVKLYDSRENNN
jgi:hypothetical protein